MFIQSNSYILKDTKDDIFTTIFQETHPISHFCPIDDYHAFSSQNELFALKNRKYKKMASFKSSITTVVSHESLVCAGALDGEVQVFSEHRAAIRRFKDHHGEITDITVTPSNLLISSSRDGTIKFYNLIEGKLIHSIQIEKGYANCLLVYQNKLYVIHKDILVISLDDFKMALVYTHNSTIDAISMISDTVAAFSCKNRVFLFDFSSGKIMKSQILHTKEITSIQSCEGKLYTCSLDGHLKTSTQDLKLINDFDFHTKLVSFSISNDKIPFIATEDGRVFSIEKETVKSKQKSFIDRRPVYEDEIDFEVIQTSKRRLTEIDSMLGRYEYKGALIRCMESRDDSQKYSVLKYISEKRAMMRALRDGDVEFVRNVLNLCIETLRIQDFTPIVIEMALIITSVYSDILVEDDSLKELIEILSDSINEQVAFEEAYLKTIAFIESFPSQ